MAFSRTKRVLAAASLFAAALLLVACEGPSVDRQQGSGAPQPGGTKPADHGSGMVLRCSVCRGTGRVVGFNGVRTECENCEGTGKIKHTK
jgi:DnaJ-class molecular chaperone